MIQQSETEKYRRLNTYMADYIAAAAKDADPEELHCRLRDLMREAIKVDISLEKMLEVFSTSTMQDSTLQHFIEKISKHYARAKDTAFKKNELVEAGKVSAR